MPAISPSTVVLALLVPLLAWHVYRRFRRMVGQQRLSKVRPWIQLVLFPVLVVLFGLSALAHPERLLWLAAGLAAGALLGVFGLSKTVFQPTPEGLFYTPSVHLGIVLSSLFALRIAYRLVQKYFLEPQMSKDFSDFARSPMTLAVFGLLAGYYIAYAIGLARWRQRVLRAKRLRELGQSDA